MICPLSSVQDFNCSHPYPNCTNGDFFDFNDFYTISLLTSACPDDSRIAWSNSSVEGASLRTPSLTYEACLSFAGGSGPTLYDGSSIWLRLTTWKFPLFQLIAQFPRPPLSLGVESFVLAHLFGNPVCTIRSLLLRLYSCQNRAEFWKREFSVYDELLDVLEVEDGVDRQARAWKALANVVDTYDEWGRQVGDAVERVIYEKLATTHNIETKREFFISCIALSDVLAADRATKFLPISIAMCFFVGTIGIAFGRTAEASASDPNTSINIEAHSIAMTALYFWLLPATILASIIGTSQTENSIPRALLHFRKMVGNLYAGDEQMIPGPEIIRDQERRKLQGGIYSWHSCESRDNIASAMLGAARDASSPKRLQRGLRPAMRQLLRTGTSIQPGARGLAFSVSIVTSSVLTSFLISFLVPPVGIGCRSITELAIGAMWLSMVVFESRPFSRFIQSLRAPKILPLPLPLALSPHIPSSPTSVLPIPTTSLETSTTPLTLAFTATFSTISALCGLLTILAVQLGIFNSCSCYSRFGHMAVQLPGAPAVHARLVRDQGFTFPLLVAGCLLLHLILVPAIVALHFPDAIRVFLQRDSGEKWPVLELRWWKRQKKRRRDVAA